MTAILQFERFMQLNLSAFWVFVVRLQPQFKTIKYQKIRIENNRKQAHLLKQFYLFHQIDSFK